jgi:DNA end-binding protein Ku
MPATVWKGFISFGLVSFPVRLFAAARPQVIHFHMLHDKDLSRVKEVLYCAEEDKPITRGEIVKGTEITKGEYVVVTDEELKKIAPPTASTMDILQFVAASAVDPIFLNSSYYVAPDEAGAKPYALLMHAMSETKHAAIAKITMHGREHIAMIRPASTGLVLHTMYFADELQRANAPELPKQAKYSAKELDLARNLIEHLTDPFKPEQYHDEYRANVERLLEQKQKGQKITAVAQPKKKPVVDILDALRQSLAKPAKGGSATHRKAAPRRTHKAA